jgi:hypothetical protein
MKVRGFRGVAAGIALLLFVSGIAVLAQTQSKAIRIGEVSRFGFAGVSEVNNVLRVEGLGLFVAPFAPSAILGTPAPEGEEGFGPAQQSYADLTQLDNHYLYLINPDTPDREAARFDLGDCYFPSNIVYSGGRVFVRGTKFVQTGDDEYQSCEVVVYLHFDDKGNVSAPVTLPIPGVATDPTRVEVPGLDKPWASSALDDIVAGPGCVIFANGATLFSIDTFEGNIRSEEIVPAPDFDSEGVTISRLSFDEESNTLVILVNWNQTTKKGIKYFSKVLFYTVGEGGTLSQLRVFEKTDFPLGTSLTPRSDIAVVNDPETKQPLYAQFVTDEGALCQADLAGTGGVRRLGTFSELATIKEPCNGECRAPRFIRTDPVSRSVLTGVQGFTLQIRRPAYNRPGRIRRPAYVTNATESPVLVFAKLGKANKVVDSRVSTTFSDQVELFISNPVLVGESQAILATSSGLLLSINLAEPDLKAVGDLGGAGVEKLSYVSSERLLVGVRSFGADDTGWMTTEGEVVLGRLDSNEGAAAFFFPRLSFDKWFVVR